MITEPAFGIGDLVYFIDDGYLAHGVVDSWDNETRYYDVRVESDECPIIALEYGAAWKDKEQLKPHQEKFLKTQLYRLNSSA